MENMTVAEIVEELNALGVEFPKSGKKEDYLRLLAEAREKAAEEPVEAAETEEVEEVAEAEEETVEAAETAPATFEVIVTAARLAVREEPRKPEEGEPDNMIGILEQGTRVEVQDTAEDFYELIGTDGFIMKVFTKPIVQDS